MARVDTGGNKSASLSQRIVLAIIRSVFRVIFCWKVKGKENIPSNDPFIVIANHVHLLDPILLELSLPRWINFMAKDELFRSPFLRLILRWAQVFSVQRQGTIKKKQQALRRARDLLGTGQILGMFPEGSRSRDGKLRMGKPGSAVIAARIDVAIIPIGIVGTDKIKGINWLWKRPGIVVNIGEPFKVPQIEGKLNRPQMKSLTDLMMRRISALLPPENRGVYLNDEKHGD